MPLNMALWFVTKKERKVWQATCQKAGISRYIGKKKSQDIADSGLSLKNTMGSPVAITLIIKKVGIDIPTFKMWTNYFKVK